MSQPDAHQLNRYAYVGGNPETKTDPTGHTVWTPWTGVNALEVVGSVIYQGIPQGIQYILQMRAMKIAMKGLNNAGQREAGRTRFTERPAKMEQLLQNEDFQSRSYKAGESGMRQVDRALEEAKLAEGDAKVAKGFSDWGGSIMLGVGFAIDLFTTHSQYESDHAGEGSDTTREVRGWSSGGLHAGLSTIGAMGGAVLGMMIPVPGLDIAAAIVFSAAGAYAGDFVADNYVAWTDSLAGYK